jgi:hypothetical protein
MTAANTPLRPYKCAYSSAHSEQTMKPASPGGPAHWKGMLMTEIGFEHVDVVWKQYNFAVYGGTKARKTASKPVERKQIRACFICDRTDKSRNLIRIWAFVRSLDRFRGVADACLERPALCGINSKRMSSCALCSGLGSSLCGLAPLQ